MEQKPVNRREQRRQEQKRRRRNRQLAILAISAVLLILIIVLVVKAVGAIGNAVNQDETAPVAAESQQETSGEILEVTFKATGDNLIHNTIYQQAAARSSDGGYDFSYCYEDIIPVIEGTDLVFVNQETPVATSVFEPSNYPLFNTPSETVTDLKSAGFNLFNLASNHTLDKGVRGMEATLDFMDSVQGITHFGCYRNYTDEHTPRLVEKNGITFAFIGVTEMTNGMSLPAIRSWISYILPKRKKYRPCSAKPKKPNRYTYSLAIGAMKMFSPRISVKRTWLRTLPNGGRISSLVTILMCFRKLRL